jgi:hypothetical protein
MRMYLISDKDGNALADGVQEQNARQIAQRIANRLGESVRLSASDARGAGEEVKPGALAIAARKIKEAANLLGLLDAVQEYAVLIGLGSDGQAEDRVDLTSLPKFGGEQPLKILQVWSWDETHVLVGSGSGPFPTEWRLVDRKDWEKVGGDQ